MEGKKYCIDCRKVEVSSHAMRCKECNRQLKIQQNRSYRSRVQELNSSTPQVEVAVPAPRKQSLSDAEAARLNAEQRKLDAEIDKKLYARCGYTKDPGRSLTLEEMEAVAHTITHVSQVRNTHSDMRIYLGAV